MSAYREEILRLREEGRKREREREEEEIRWKEEERRLDDQQAAFWQKTNAIIEKPFAGHGVFETLQEIRGFSEESERRLALVGTRSCDMTLGSDEVVRKWKEEHRRRMEELKEESRRWEEDARRQWERRESERRLALVETCPYDMTLGSDYTDGPIEGFINCRTGEWIPELPCAEMEDDEGGWMDLFDESEGIALSKSLVAKTEEVQIVEEPFVSTMVNEFLGVSSVDCQLVMGVMCLHDPLTALLKKNRVCFGGEEEERALVNFIARLPTALELSCLAVAADLPLHTVANMTGLGAVLSQGARTDERVVSYSSRTLMVSEKNEYQTGKHARWAEKLAGLVPGLVFEHCPGPKKAVDEALLRVVPAISKLSPELDTSLNFIGSPKSTVSGVSICQDVVALVALNVSPPSQRINSCEELSKQQRSVESLKEVVTAIEGGFLGLVSRRLSDIRLDKGLVYHKGSDVERVWRFVLPNNLPLGGDFSGGTEGQWREVVRRRKARFLCPHRIAWEKEGKSVNLLCSNVPAVEVFDPGIILCIAPFITVYFLDRLAVLSEFLRKSRGRPVSDTDRTNDGEVDGVRLTIDPSKEEVDPQSLEETSPSRVYLLSCLLTCPVPNAVDDRRWLSWISLVTGPAA